MEQTTKEKIRDRALELFAKNGYLGTSMSEIASKLGITKAALYKHYESKEAILCSIVDTLKERDIKRSEEYEMPYDADYKDKPIEKIRAYTKAQFRHWTEEEYSSLFRKLITIEQYRDPIFASLFQEYLSYEPLKYITKVFETMCSNPEETALLFYGPIFLLYSIYDRDKDLAIKMLDSHINSFIADFEAKRGN